MRGKNAVLLAIALVAGGFAVVQATRAMKTADRDSEDFPEGTFWVCQAPECRAEFVKSVRELADFYSEHPNEPLPCPECGRTETARALRCPRCERFFARPPAGVHVPVCPHCQRELPPAIERDGG